MPEGIIKKPWRPENWEGCPCDDCLLKQGDEYGLICDLSCGKYSAWANKEAGAAAMLEALEAKGSFIVGAKSGADDSILNYSIPNEGGWLVFIPEE